MGTDISYTTAFEHLLSTFAKLAQSPKSEDGLTYSMIGLEAVASIALSPSLRGSNSEKQIAMIVPAILHNLMAIKEEFLYNIKQQSDRHRSENVLLRRSSLLSNATTLRSQNLRDADNPRSQEEQIETLALEVLRTLFESSDISQLRDTTTHLLSYFLTTNPSSPSWPSTIILMTAGWAPINLRFHILGSCLRRLESFRDEDWPTEDQTLILTIVHNLLDSTVNLIGLSTTDVLDSLLSIAQRLLQKTSGDDLDKLLQWFVRKTDTETEIENYPKFAFLLQITKTVVAIMSHSYYTNQAQDMLQYILERSSSPASNGDTYSCVSRLFYLSSARSLIFGIENKRSDKTPIINIQISAFESTMAMMCCPSRLIRLQYLRLFLDYLKLDTLESEKTSSANGKWANGVIKKFQNTTYEYLTRFANAAEDMQLFKEVFEVSLVTMNTAEKLSFIPLLYTVETYTVETYTAETELMTNRQTTEIVLLELFLLVMRKSLEVAAFTKAENFNASNGQLPSLQSVVEVLRSDEPWCSANQADQILFKTWSPESGVTSISRTVSLRQPSRSRVNMSAVASRESLALPGDVTRSNNMRIDNLKKALAGSPTGTTLPPHQEHKANLEQIFNDIELQPIFAVSNETTYSSLASTSGERSANVSASHATVQETTKPLGRQIE